MPTEEEEERRQAARDALEDERRTRFETRVRGVRRGLALPDDPKEANIEAERDLDEQEAEGRPLGTVRGGESPTFQEWDELPGDFQVAQASDPAGGQTVQEAAGGHIEEERSKLDRFYDLIREGERRLAEDSTDPHDSPYMREMGNVYEFLAPEYQAIYDQAESGRPEMARSERTRREFEGEFPEETEAARVKAIEARRRRREESE